MLWSGRPIVCIFSDAGRDTSLIAQLRILLSTHTSYSEASRLLVCPIQKPLIQKSSSLEGSPPKHHSSVPSCLSVLHGVRAPPTAGRHFHLTLARLPVFLPLHGASCPPWPSPTRGPSSPLERPVVAFSIGPVVAFSIGAASSTPVNSTRR